MKRTFLALLLSTSVFSTYGQVAAPSSSQSMQTVHWHVNSFPPYMMVGGPDDGKGAFDRAMKVMMQGMPNFQHKLVDAALPRIIESIKTEADACSAALIRTKEREAIMLFSTPFMHLLPNAVVTLRKHLPQFQSHLNERGEVRLDSALGSGKIKVGLAPDRSYGTALDPVLKKHASAIVPVPSKDQFASRLLKLAYQNEFDAIVGYAVELKYTLREQKLTSQDFVVLQIAEAPDLLPVAVGCSRSDPGKRIVAAIDGVLATKGAERMMDGFYRELLDDESAIYYDGKLKQARAAK